MNLRKRNIKVHIEPTAEQVELVKRMGSRNKTESYAAAEALAAVMPEPILQVIEQAPVFSNYFQKETYSSSAASLLALDPYFDVRARNFLNVWTQSQPGGTQTNFTAGQTDIYVQTYPITSAVSLRKNQLRAGNLNYLAANLSRIVQEVLLVQNTNAAFVVFNSLAGARIDGTASTATSNLTLARANTARRFQIDDFNTLMIGYDRATASWVGGTPVNELRSITDMFGSPEWMGQLRSISYQPQNTVQGAVTVQGGSSIAAPDSLREGLMRAGNVATLFDINLHKVYEMGIGRDFNTVFDTAIGSVALPGYGTGFGGGSTSVFAGATEEVVIGLNLDMFDLVKMRMTEAPEGGEFNLVNDDTFTTRSDMIGYVGDLREGYISVDSRGKFGLIW